MIAASGERAPALTLVALRAMAAGEASVLRGGQLQFPDNPEFAVFLALALHDLGQHAEAMKLLLTTIADTADDPGLTAYQRAIRHEASKLAAAGP